MKNIHNKLLYYGSFYKMAGEEIVAKLERGETLDEKDLNRLRRLLGIREKRKQ